MKNLLYSLKKNCIIYFFNMIILSSCAAIQNDILLEGKTYENFRGFEPVDPIEYDDSVQITTGKNSEDKEMKIINKEMKLLTNDEMLQFLNNETVLVSIGQVSTEGKITYLPITVSSKNSSYKVTMDYMKFATLGQKDEQEYFIGFKRVGVGLRLISLITTTEAGINVGDLSSLGIAAKSGKVKGTLMVEVVGIKSKEITALLPLPSEINQTTIQNAMQALATIKSKIYDNETQLFPQVMAVKSVSFIKDDNTKSSNFYNERNETRNGELIRQENKIKLQTKNNKIEPSKDLQLAENLQLQAFEFLFKKDINNAIQKFKECENAYPSYLSIYEIKNLLIKEKSFLLNSNSAKWKEVYLKILNDYSFKLSEEIKKELKRKIESQIDTYEN